MRRSVSVRDDGRKEEAVLVVRLYSRTKFTVRRISRSRVELAHEPSKGENLPDSQHKKEELLSVRPWKAARRVSFQAKLVRKSEMYQWFGSPHESFQDSSDGLRSCRVVSRFARFFSSSQRPKARQRINNMLTGEKRK